MGPELCRMQFQCWALTLGHASVFMHLSQVPPGTGGAALPGQASFNATADGGHVCTVSLALGRWLQSAACIRQAVM